MGCIPCQKARQRVMNNVRQGNVAGAGKALSLGMQIMMDKARGVDIVEKYGRELGLTPEEIEAIRRDAERKRKLEDLSGDD